MITFVKRHLRRRIGWLPLYEMRNKVLIGHTAVGLRRFENAEVARLSREQPGLRSAARVATIVLTFKRPEGLLTAVRSVLSQTVTDQVVLVVDDGGGLPELPDDPRLFAVSLSRNINVLGVSRNVGIRLTDSDFVAFLDDDNVWQPNHLEVALAALEGTGRSAEAGRAPDAIYTAMSRVTEDGHERDVLSVPFDRRAASNASFLDSNPFVARRTSALRFSRIRRTRATLPKEDWELIFRYSRRHRIEHVPVTTVKYLVNTSSFWTTWRNPEAPEGE